MKTVGKGTARKATQIALGEGASFIAKKGISQSMKQIAKSGGNPMFIAGDFAEVGVEKITGSPEAGKATSLAVYLGAGAVAGGPAGAAVAAGFWSVGQIFSAIF